MKPVLASAANLTNRRPPTLGLISLALLVCCTAITNQSYWLDEAATAYNASLPTLADWWRSLRADANSNLQAPLYMLFAWCWAKLVGLNEFALRAGNVPWFLLGVLVLERALAGAARLRWAMALVVFSSPFAWYYLNDARPYTLQIALSCMLFGALYRLSLTQAPRGEEQPWVMVLCVSSFLLAASGMLAMLWMGAYLGAALLSVPGSLLRRLARDYWGWLGLTFLMLLALGLFYLWTLSVGARASAVGTVDLRNVFFIPFELLGFSGLGPGRLAIRTGGLELFLPWLPWLAAYGIVLLLVLSVGWARIATDTSRRTRSCWIFTFVLVAGLILTTGRAMHFRVLGRHCAPVLPLLLFVLGKGVVSLSKQRGPREQLDTTTGPPDLSGSGLCGIAPCRINPAFRLTSLSLWALVSKCGRGRPGLLIVIVFFGLNLTSCLLLRFSERHARDDYRGAAALGRQALSRHEVVWWNADPQAAVVYHLPVTTQIAVSNAALFLVNPTNRFEQGLSKPDLVLSSKPDVYDNQGALADYLARAGFKRSATLTAFTGWRPPKPRRDD